jgi:hypothetical protein
MEVGTIPMYDRASVESFGADIIFTDEIEKSPDAFDLTQISNLAPFINLMAYQEPSKQPRYESDISYIGPISDIDGLMLDLYRLGYNVRNFYGSPSMLPCYSGSISMSECWNVYKNSKVSPIPKNDIGYRELDIIASDGNPLKFSNKDEFITESIKGIKGKKFKTKVSKKIIFSDNTNFDRLATILDKMGFGAVAKKIKQEKLCLV